VVALPGADGVLALPVVAIATSCVAALARARIAAAGLRAPQVVVTADQVSRGKPAPDPYLLAAERLGVDPADCVVLEDAPAGVAAGKAAGMAVWAVTNTHEAADLSAADVIYDGLPELLRRLGGGRDRGGHRAAPPPTSCSRTPRTDAPAGGQGVIRTGVFAGVRDCLKG